MKCFIFQMITSERSQIWMNLSDLKNLPPQDIPETVPLPSSPVPPSLQRKHSNSSLSPSLSQLKLDLLRVEQELGWAEKQRKQLLMQAAEQKQQEIQAREAAGLVEKLHRERAEFKRKIRLIEISNKFKRNVIRGNTSRKLALSHQTIGDRKKEELETKLRGIHQKSMNRIQEMESFQKRYNGQILNLLDKNKKIKDRLIQRKKFYHSYESNGQSMMENVRDPPNWSFIKKHQKDYIHLAKYYALQNDTHISQEWNEKNIEERSKSNPYLKAIEFKIPKSKYKVETETHNIFQETIVNFDNKQQNSHGRIPKNEFEQILPELRKDLRRGLRKLANHLSTINHLDQQSMQIIKPKNQKILETIKQIDSRIAKRKTLRRKFRSKTSCQQQRSEADKNYLKLLSNRLLLLNSRDTPLPI